jgi:peptidoglycan/xylan/chitin deacetylase (PgdA/CDA1 family)
MRMRHRHPAASAVLCAALLSLPPAGAVFADEVLVEGLEGGRKFAPMWPGGTVEQGSEAGMPWVRVVTDGASGPTFVSNVRPYTPAVDARGRFVKVRVKVDDTTKLGGMEFRLSSDRFSDGYFAFASTMYDDPDFNVLRDGVWTTFTFSFGEARVEGKPDRGAINAIGWYVADKGGEEPVTAWWGGLSLVDEPSEGVVSFTFDDGWAEHHLAAQLMAEHGFRGTAYVIPDSIGQHGYMTLHQLVDLQERYGWDVAAHHATPFTEMRPDELESAILGVQHFLVENRFPRGAAHLAYPLGKQNTSLVRPLVRKHFATARLASDGPETLPPADPHLLRVFNVTDATRPEEVGAAARRALENKEWLILMFHHLVEGEPSNALEYGLDDFRQLLEQVAAAGIRVMSLARVWDACGNLAEEPVATGRCHPGKALAAPAP